MGTNTKTPELVLLTNILAKNHSLAFISNEAGSAYVRIVARIRKRKFQMIRDNLCEPKLSGKKIANWFNLGIYSFDRSIWTNVLLTKWSQYSGTYRGKIHYNERTFGWKWYLWFCDQISYISSRNTINEKFRRERQ